MGNNDTLVVRQKIISEDGSEQGNWLRLLTIGALFSGNVAVGFRKGLELFTAIEVKR